MSTYDEKLSILAEMISFARVDNTLKKVEYNFLLGVAEQLGIDKVTFESLFHKDVERILPKSEADRILQFHRLVLLMNVDRVQRMAELNKLHSIGMRMGLSPAAIDQVLSVMHQYPDMLVPPEVLLDIFRASYNGGVSVYKLR